MRLKEGADIYQIAKNRRTSVEMIEKFYAAHIKNTLDAASINVMRAKLVRPQSQPEGKKDSSFYQRMRSRRRTSKAAVRQTGSATA